MFVDFLKDDLGISPEVYLKKVKQHMEHSNYDPDNLFFSTREDKKLMYKKPDNTFVHFGGNLYKDYHIYKILDGTEYANYRRNLYKKRHIYYVKKSDDKYSPSNLSYKVLW
jgi:hypothetical protein